MVDDKNYNKSSITKIFYFRRSRKTIFIAVIATALCLALSSFSLIVHAQTFNGFTLPCAISTYGNAWNGQLTFDLELNSNFMGARGSGYYLVVINTTNGNVLALRESSTSYGGSSYNIAPYILMFQGEPHVGGANSAPTFATHFWNLSSDTTQDFPNVISEHDIQYDPVNNTFLTLQQYVRQVGDHSILIDKIVQVDPNGNVLWSWDPYNYIPLSEASPFNEISIFNGQTVEDFSHANTLDWDYNNSIIYLNFRNTNTFYKINQTTGELIWACGEFGNFILLGDNGQPLVGANGLPPSLWYHSHEVKQVAPDVFTMFDNDYCNNTNPNNCHSRMIELTLNETSMTAYVNWSWEAPKQYWTPYGAACLLLPNGDFLGNFGVPTHQDPSYPQNKPWNFPDTGAVFVEVNPAGQIVKTFTFPVGCYVYRIAPITNPASIFSPSPTPSPTPNITLTPTPSPIPTSSPTANPTPSPIPTSSPTANPTPSPIPTSTSTVTPNPSPTTTSPTSTVPEFPITVVSALLAAVFLIATKFLQRKQLSKSLQLDSNNSAPCGLRFCTGTIFSLL